MSYTLPVATFGFWTAGLSPLSVATPSGVAGTRGRHPARMNYVDIIFQSLSTTTPTIDSDFMEPQGTQGKRFGSAVYTRAQVSYQKTEMRSRSRAGDMDVSAGHLCFAQRDFTALSTPPKKGDKIVSIAGRSVRYRVLEIFDQGHLEGTSNIVFVYFEEDKDARASVTG